MNFAIKDNESWTYDEIVKWQKLCQLPFDESDRSFETANNPENEAIHEEEKVIY